eukprot:7103674-Alexandrium_andersonii.AAC.1
MLSPEGLVPGRCGGLPPHIGNQARPRPRPFARRRLPWRRSTLLLLADVHAQLGLVVIGDGNVRGHNLAP